MSDDTPSLAPPHVPDVVAAYMDRVADQLSEFAKAYGLEIQPYAFAEKGDEAWRHNLCGTFSGYGVILKIVTEEELAYWFQGWLWIYVKFVNPRTSVYNWVALHRWDLHGIGELLSVAQRAVEQLQLACALRLPRPDSPRPQA